MRFFREFTVVLIRNCTAWFEMGSLTDGKLMVVHPLEIKERRIVVAGKAQHYVCGSQAREEAAGGFSISALPTCDGATGPHQDGMGGFDLASGPEKKLGQMHDSVTAMWGVMDDMFANARGVLRDGNGVRSGQFQMPFSLADFRFWNQVSDAADGAWRRTMHVQMERRFDAAFNYQQMSRDLHRRDITYRSKKDFQRLQMVSGMFGLVGVSQQTEQFGDNVSRFRTGTILRVCTSDVCLRDAPEVGPGKVLAGDYWKSRAGEHGIFRMRFGRLEGKKYGTLTVRLAWHELTYRDVEGFEDKCLIV